MTPKSNSAVVLESPGELRLVDKPNPANPAANMARVEVLRVGVCGTDIHAYRGNQPMMRYPVVLGHELAVVVTELGEGAERWRARPGDLCTVMPYVNCGECSACRHGFENACTRLEVLGVHRDGGLRERFDVPARLLLPAEDIPLDSLALVEMLAIGQHAVARANVTDGDTVLVLGAGPIGLGAIAAARLRTERVSSFDISDARLEFLRQLDLAEVVATLEVFGDDPPTVVLDATGNIGSMASAPTLAAPGGRVVFIGHTKHVLGIDNPTLHTKELDLLASRNATKRDFEAVLQNLREGAIDVAPWVTTRVDPDGLLREMPVWAGGPSDMVKALVVFD